MIAVVRLDETTIFLAQVDQLIINQIVNTLLLVVTLNNHLDLIRLHEANRNRQEVIHPNPHAHTHQVAVAETMVVAAVATAAVAAVVVLAAAAAVEEANTLYFLNNSIFKNASI